MLEAIAEDVWVAAGSHRLLPGVHFPTRMVVVRKPNGGLVLHSPVELSKALVDELGRLGPVDLLIAPNSFHYAHLAGARRSFPSAHLVGPEALRAKAPDLALDTTLEESHRSGGEPFDGVFELLPLRGAPKMEEWLFLHSASETLVVTDLLFNVQDPKGALTPWVLRAAGAYREPSISSPSRSVILIPCLSTPCWSLASFSASLLTSEAATILASSSRLKYLMCVGAMPPAPTKPTRSFFCFFATVCLFGVSALRGGRTRMVTRHLEALSIGSRVGKSSSLSGAYSQNLAAGAFRTAELALSYGRSIL